MELIFEQIWEDYAEFIEKAEEFIKTRKEKELENGKDFKGVYEIQAD